MAWTLEQDKGTGELRQVHTDLWQGSHERKEWRVTDSAGRVLRRTDYALPQTLGDPECAGGYALVLPARVAQWLGCADLHHRGA